MECATLKKAALIIASDEKGLEAVFGVPAVRRLVILFLRLGFEPVLVLGRIDRLKPVLADLLPEKSFHPLDDPARLGKAIPVSGIEGETRVLALSASTVVDLYSLRRLVEDGEKPGVHFLAAGEEHGAKGVLLGSAADLVPFLGRFWGTKKTLGNNLSVHMVRGRAGIPYCLEDNKESVKTAENRLIAALSSHTEADDGFFARHFDRRVSRFISRQLARTRITPNLITLCGVSIGLTGAFLLSRAGYGPKLAGALLFLICVIVDGVDGEVARLKLQETVFGHYLDVITDNVVHVAVFVGLAFGLYHDTADSGYLHALWWMLGGFGLCTIAVYQCILRRTQEEFERSPRLMQLLALLSNRDFAYLIAILALCHRLNWFLLGAAFGTYVFAAALWILSFFESRVVTAKSS